MNPQPSNLTEFIVAEVQRQTSEDSIQKLVEEKIGKIIASAVDSSLRSYGNVGKQIEEAVANSLQIGDRLDIPSYGHMVMTLLRSKMDETLSTLVNEHISAEINDILQIAPKELHFSKLIEQMIERAEEDGERHGSNITCIIEESSNLDGYYHIYLDIEDETRKHDCEAFIGISSLGKIYHLVIDKKDVKSTITMGHLPYWKKALFAAYCSGTKIIMDDLDPSTTIGDY